MPDSLPLLIVTGASDEQVPLTRVEDLYAANSARLQGGIGLIVVQDEHALCSLLNDAKPAPHLDGSDGVDPNCGTLSQMVQACWQMRQRVVAKSGYDHDARLPADSANASAPARPAGRSVRLQSSQSAGQPGLDAVVASANRWKRNRHQPWKAAFWGSGGSSKKCAVM